MILYVEKPKDSDKEKLELINVFGKVARYKINMQKSVLFLYINSEQFKKEIKKTIPFILAYKRIKYIEVS